MVAFTFGGSRQHAFVLLAASVFSLGTSSVIPAQTSKQNPLPQPKMVPQEFRGGAKRFAEDSHMPSLFSEEEDEFDTYAACLAATEGLRRIRDSEMAAAMEEHKEGSSKPLEDVEKEINMRYAKSSTRVLRSMGMPVDKFNELGRTIAKDPNLKKKVKEQAYLYRMAATVNMDRVALVEEPVVTDPFVEKVAKDKIQLFSESLSEIEELRSSQIRRLTKTMKVDKFPENVNISDPALLPFLSPRVRAVVQAFPLQAEEIVKKHGLDAEDFNKMLEETKHNPFFRWKIQKQVKEAVSLDREASAVNPSTASAEEKGQDDQVGTQV